MQLVAKYGRMWARNTDNLNEIDKTVEGVYVLYDGTMPVYVGEGFVWDRLCAHRNSNRKKHFWDYFSWYAISDPELRRDTEALLLKTLPYYLRLLNKQRGKFIAKNSRRPQKQEIPEAVQKPKFVSIRKGRSKSRLLASIKG